MIEEFIHGDPLQDMPRFRALPKKLNGHRLFYKGDAPSVKETKQEQALAEVAAQQWQYYQDTYRPLEDSFMKNVNDLNTDAAHGVATGAAGSATTAAFDNTRKQASSQLETSRVNPNSGKYQTVMSGLSDSEAVSSGDSKARAANTVDENYATGLSNISAIGRGQATQSQLGLSSLANNAAAKAAGDARSSWNNTAANINTAGALAGAAAYGLSGPKNNTGAKDPYVDPQETWSQMQWDN